ncbi:MAG: 1-acyl-sn-glycerol-3-phosphate acyltransferase [Planctomycetes bacterium]|nr:1-acyl-sn-glycerol-3-phosphate acyltransferase [Planctomycetota bacterium]
MTPEISNLVPKVLLALAAMWFVLAIIFRLIILPWLSNGPREDPAIGFLWRFVQIQCRLIHRLKVFGDEVVPKTIHPGGLIVVANHTGAIDPVMIQASCPFHIRWMMASEMMGTNFDWLWKVEQIIPVDRDGRDTAPTREAIRHVKAGRVLGIFPEGRIVIPPREIRPFLAGVGLIVHRTKAPVLLAWISGTPDTNEMGKSLLTPSRSRLQFIEIMDFTGEKHAIDIARKLRERIAEVSGWPVNDEPLPPLENDSDPFLH